jgi:MFS family permease
MANGKMSETFKSYKTLLQRNLFIIILINCANSFASAMLNGIQSKVGAAAGVDIAFIGLVATLYSATGMITRLPVGTMCDKYNIKKIMLFGALFRAVASLSWLFVSGTVSYTVARLLTAISWAVMGVTIPAILGIAMDKKALGAAYSLYVGFWSLTHNYGRPTGLAIYQKYGIKPVVYLAVGLYLGVAVLSFLLDYKKIEEQLQKSRLEKSADAAVKPQKRSLLPSAILVKAIPACLLIAVPMFAYQADLLYTPILADERGIKIEAALYIAGTVAAIMGIVSGFLCDFIGSTVVAVIFYLARGIGAVMIGLAASQGMMSTALILYSFGENYDTPIMLLCMKGYDKSELGRFTGTEYFILDLTRLLSGIVVGLLAKAGYPLTFDICGGLILLGLTVVPFLFKGKKAASDV